METTEGYVLKKTLNRFVHPSKFCYLPFANITSRMFLGGFVRYKNHNGWINFHDLSAVCVQAEAQNDLYEACEKWLEHCKIKGFQLDDWTSETICDDATKKAWVNNFTRWEQPPEWLQKKNPYPRSGIWVHPNIAIEFLEWAKSNELKSSHLLSKKNIQWIHELAKKAITLEQQQYLEEDYLSMDFL